MSRTYYNEFDPKAAATLRQLIHYGLIAPGDVDERSIEDVLPRELHGYTQCHFFAGFGIWSLALRMAGWPDSRPVWTGSCPCQPFSSAGKAGGFADERHLWPAFFHLIQHGKRPDVPLYGEQVASPDALAWLDLVCADLEAQNHTVRAFDLCAAGFGAPIIRQRLFWLACGAGQRCDRWRTGEKGDGGSPARVQSERFRDVSRLGEPSRTGLQERIGYGEFQSEAMGTPSRQTSLGGSDSGGERPGPTNGFWRVADWLLCRDDKWRPVAPGTFPLAHGYPERVGILRGAGNAISPQVAASFIEVTKDYV